MSKTTNARAYRPIAAEVATRGWVKFMDDLDLSMDRSEQDAASCVDLTRLLESLHEFANSAEALSREISSTFSLNGHTVQNHAELFLALRSCMYGDDTPMIRAIQDAEFWLECSKKRLAGEKPPTREPSASSHR